GSEPSSPVSCGATAGTASRACSSTGPTDSKNGPAAGGDSSRCGSTAASTGPTDSKDGSATGTDSSRCGSTGAEGSEGFGFKPFNRLKAPPAFAKGNALCRTGEFHGLSWSET